eukprot:gene1980-3853_t
MDTGSLNFSKKIINTPSRVVSEFIEGVLLVNRSLKCIPGMNVLVRADIEEIRNSTVTLISGGGSGHEPAHAGYIGPGMLSAAVLGNSFASPSVSAILSAIRICAGPKGTILIVKNYTGDRLNFGMAVEKAKLEGILVKMIIVADDCALAKGKGITGGRGIAGTILVHKVAGAAAAAGLSLEEVYEEAKYAASTISTVGIALTTCTVPGCPPSTRLQGPLFEVGMGIHGEPGREQRALPESDTADTIAKIMVDVILENTDCNISTSTSTSSSSNFNSQDPLVLLINNLGSTPIIELYIVARRIVTYIQEKQGIIVRIYIGSFMTAFEMCGISLSIMRTKAHDKLLLERLDANTTAQAWIHTTEINPQETLHEREISYSLDNYANKVISGGFKCHKSLVIIQAIVLRIIAIEPELTQYDMICGDGDCGLVMRAGAQKILEYLSQILVTTVDPTPSEETLPDIPSSVSSPSSTAALPPAVPVPVDTATLCDKLADAVGSAMGGTSGALLEIMLRAMASSLMAVKTYGGATVDMRTMLDALIPATLTLVEGGTCQAAAIAARTGAESTKTMTGLAGRSNYIQQEQMRGVPDPGAVAIAEAFEAAASES